MAEQIRVPNLGESISEATIGKWFKKVGEHVAEDEPIAELETDKVAMEVNAPVSGVLTAISAAEGDTVEVGAVIAEIDMSGEVTVAPAAGGDVEPPHVKPQTPDAPPPSQDPAPTSLGTSLGTSAPSAPSVPMSPAVRKLIAEHNLDAATIVGSGKDGRLVKQDVLAAIEAGTAAPASSGPAAVAAGPREERVPMTRLRKRIAERLKEAQNTAAMLTTYNEADMSAVMAARAEYRDEFEKKHGVRLGFMSFFAKACVHALKEVPAVNAQIDGDDIIYKNYYNIGVAVSAPTGLVVPVVRDVDTLGFADCEKAIGELGRRARDGKLTLDDFQGGTFTVSNGGVFGSLMSSPILNTPQSGILGMHKIQERPVVVDGEIVIRPMMYLALSYDHRIIDGREAVTFLVRVKDCIEDPKRLLLDI